MCMLWLLYSALSICLPLMFKPELLALTLLEVTALDAISYKSQTDTW